MKRRQRRYHLESSPVVWLVILLVFGALVLAIIDKDTRTTFTDLAQVGLGGYIALLMPREDS
jgi:hypothetical protein